MRSITLTWAAGVICLMPLLAGAAANTEVLPATDSEKLSVSADRARARTGHENEIISVNKFTGGLLAKFHDVHIPGNGGMDIDIHRVFNSAGSKGSEWGPTLSYNKSFPYAALGRAPDLASLPPPPSGQNLWSFLAAPSVSMHVAFRPNPGTYPQQMSDDLDRVCTQVPWRTSNGLYGLIVAYTLNLPNGEIEPLVPVETGMVRSRSGWRLTCSGGQGGTHLLSDPAGRRYTMARKVNNRVCERIDNICWDNQTLLATQQTDLVGNWIQYGYTDFTEWPGWGRPYLTSVSTSDGRNLTLSYVDAGGHYRLNQISGPRGATWTYQFNSAGNLVSVTLPEGRAWQYSYWPDVTLTGHTITSGVNVNQPGWARSGLLQRVTYPTGGYVDISYAPSEIWFSGLWWWEGDPGEYNLDMANNPWPFKEDWIKQWNMRVTSLAYSDGGSWTFSYAPSRTHGNYDVTTVTGPSAVETYKYFGEGYFIPSSYWSDNYGTFGFAALVGGSWSYLTDAWRLGLLVEKRIGSSRVETYTWTPRVHSSIFYHATSGRAGLRDESTKVADLAQRTIVQDGLTYTSVYSNYDSFGNPATIVETGPGGSQRTITRSYYIDLVNNILRQPKDESLTLNAE